MRKSQQFGFLLLELLCAISLFALSVTAAGGLLVQLLRAQKCADERFVLLEVAGQLLETGSLPVGQVVAQELAPVRVGPTERPFYLLATRLTITGSVQSLVLTRCLS